MKSTQFVEVRPRLHNPATSILYLNAVSNLFRQRRYCDKRRTRSSAESKSVGVQSLETSNIALGCVVRSLETSTIGMCDSKFGNFDYRIVQSLETSNIGFGLCGSKFGDL